MKSETLGKNTLAVEILSIDTHGIWLFANGKEYFLPYNDFPWFEEAKVSDILDVQLLNHFHLYWPKLDIDLDLNSIEDTSRTPLIYK